MSVRPYVSNSFITFSFFGLQGATYGRVSGLSRLSPSVGALVDLLVDPFMLNASNCFFIVFFVKRVIIKSGNESVRWSVHATVDQCARSTVDVLQCFPFSLGTHRGRVVDRAVWVFSKQLDNNYLKVLLLLVVSYRSNFAITGANSNIDILDASSHL